MAFSRLVVVWFLPREKSFCGWSWLQQISEVSASDAESKTSMLSALTRGSAVYDYCPAQGDAKNCDFGVLHPIQQYTLAPLIRLVPFLMKPPC
jgi:hypothetical protein